MFPNVTDRTKGKAYAQRFITLLGAWLLLTGTSHAAAHFGHESAGWHLLHVVGMYLNVVMMCVWVFILGSCIGSFLNVVIYRMPAGMALSHPGSRCPKCETELSARDNIPILGWLILRGRCRYCQVSISSRYPLIETLVGLLFLLVVLVETNTGAANLPLRPPTAFYGGVIDAIFLQGHWHLLGYFLAHVYYLTLVLAVCMIGFDGHTPPRQLILPGVVIPCVIGILWPELRPVSAIVPVPESLLHQYSIQWTLPQWLDGDTLQVGMTLQGLVAGLAGVFSGLLTGWLASQAAGRGTALAATLAGVFMLCGAFCGWQMTWPLLGVVLVCTAVLKLSGQAALQSGLPLLLFGTCTAFLALWSRLLNGTLLIGYDGWSWSGFSSSTDWAVTTGVLAGSSLLLSRVGVRSSDNGGAQPEDAARQTESADADPPQDQACLSNESD